MNDGLRGVSDELVSQLLYADRGPQRNGIFALWLVVNTCASILGDHHVQEKNHRKRIAALRKRMGSLSLPPLLRKAITSALHDLNHDSAAAATMALNQLAAPVRDSLGGVCGRLTEKAAKVGYAMVGSEAPTKLVVEGIGR